MLEQVQEIKLLGVIVNQNLTWESNTNYICKKARKKIWLLKNMKISGLRQNELVDAYKKEVRSLLEMAQPAWHSGLTLEQTILIERVQKSALAAILGKRYVNYDNALEETKLKRLSVRRNELCSKFVNKNMKSEKPMFTRVLKSHDTRSNPENVQEFQCRTKSMYNSSLPFLARLYNKNQQKWLVDTPYWNTENVVNIKTMMAIPSDLSVYLLSTDVWIPIKKPRNYYYYKHKIVSRLVSLYCWK